MEATTPCCPYIFLGELMESEWGSKQKERENKTQMVITLWGPPKNQWLFESLMQNSKCCPLFSEPCAVETLLSCTYSCVHSAKFLSKPPLQVISYRRVSPHFRNHLTNWAWLFSRCIFKGGKCLRMLVKDWNEMYVSIAGTCSLTHLPATHRWFNHQNVCEYVCE